MQGKKFGSENEAIDALKPGQKAVVVQDPDYGLEIYGSPTHIQHDVDCLLIGAKAKKKQSPRIIERAN